MDRWEKIAELMGRTVYEVTRMSSKVKARLAQRLSEAQQEESVRQVKVKGQSYKYMLLHTVVKLRLFVPSAF